MGNLAETMSEIDGRLSGRPAACGNSAALGRGAGLAGGRSWKDWGSSCIQIRPPAESVVGPQKISGTENTRTP